MFKNSNDNRGLVICLPKKGRLCDDFARVMEDAGFVQTKAGKRADFGTMADMTRRALAPVEALIQRPMDSLMSLVDGVADLAIVGRDTLIEFNAAAKAEGYDANAVCEVTTFPDVSPCRLVIAGPASLTLKNESDLAGLRIATSYPETLKSWLAERGIRAGRIVKRDGGVEDTIRQGLADVILDVVQTGESLLENKLEEKFVVADSTAVLVRRNADFNPVQERISTAIAARLSVAVSPPVRKAAFG